MEWIIRIILHILYQTNIKYCLKERKIWLIMFIGTSKEAGQMPEENFDYVEPGTPDYIPKPEEPDEIECEDDEVF